VICYEFHNFNKIKHKQATDHGGEVIEVDVICELTNFEATLKQTFALILASNMELCAYVDVYI